MGKMCGFVHLSALLKPDIAILILKLNSENMAFGKAKQKCHLKSEQESTGWDDGLLASNYEAILSLLK